MADTVPTAPPAWTKPIAFGPYMLLRKLGSGGMAETHLAERSGPGNFRRKVCLKLILSERAADKAFLLWFFDEAKIHAELHHEHIVQVYEFGEYEGRNYLALEFVDGCDLRTLMHRLEDAQLRLPHALAVLIAYEMAAALDCAHKLQIGGVPQSLVHRDLSPANILLSHQGHSKLSDFGVVKAASRVTRTETGMTKGKVPYMSPEQIMGGDIDGRTDLFALGVILFELLSGRHPYRKKSDDIDISIAKRIVEADRPTLKQVAPDVPDALCAIVEQLLVKLDARVASAAALLDLLTPLAPGAAASRELGEFVEAGRSSRDFPATAIQAVAQSPAGPLQVPRLERAVARTEIVRKADAPSVEADTFRPKALQTWSRIALVLGTVVTAGALSLWGGGETPERPPRAAVPPAAQAAQTAPAKPEQSAPAAPPSRPSAAAEAPAPAAIAPPTPEAATISEGAPLRPSGTERARRTLRSRDPRASREQSGTAEAERASSSTKTGTATLRVIVLPFGTVEVDGKRGKAPMLLELDPGSYAIRAGRTDALSHRESVRLAEGDQKEVIIDLEAGQ